MLHDFCRLQNIEDFRSRRNSAAEWSRNVLTVSKCERSRIGSKWNQWIFWIFEFGGNLFSSLYGFLNVESISLLSYCRLYFSRVFCLDLAFDRQQLYEMIYSLFRWHATLKLMFHLHQVYASLYLDRCWITVPWCSQELYFAMWSIKHSFI